MEVDSEINKNEKEEINQLLSSTRKRGALTDDDNLDVHDIADSAIVIYHEDYYSKLLNSLNFNAEKTDYQKHLEVKATELHDERSPYAYMKGGLHSKRLAKALMSKSEGINGVNTKRQLELEREIKRTNYLCERDAREKMLARRVNGIDAVIERAGGPFRLTAKEKNIEKKLLAPYRHNEHLAVLLIQRFNEYQSTVKKNQKKTVEIRASSPPKANLDEKIAEVKARRDNLLAEQTQQLEFRKLEKEERSQFILSQLATSQQDNRVKKWLAITVALSKLHAIYKTIEGIRDSKKKNLRSWKASKTIQRAWRRYSNPVVVKNTVSISEKLKMAAGNKDSQQIFQLRVDASNQIYNFLKFFYIAGKCHVYLQKIRKSQFFFRRHRVINDARMSLLSQFFQECLYPLTLQINLVLSNKGLDIENSMSSFEINTMKYFLNSITNAIYPLRVRNPPGSAGPETNSKMEKQTSLKVERQPSHLKPEKQPSQSFQPSTTSFLLSKIFSEFFSVEFHALLRSKIKSLTFFQKEYLQAFFLHQPQYHHVTYSTFENEFSKLWRDCVPYIRRKVLLAFLLEKRRQFLVSLHYQEPLQVIIPEVSQEDVHQFIKGGTDPLISQIADINKQIKEWQIRISKPVYPFRKEKAEDSDNENEESIPQESDWKCPIMLLLSSISAGDILSFFLQLGEMNYQYKQDYLKNADGYKLLPVHRKLSSAMAHTSHVGKKIHAEELENQAYAASHTSQTEEKSFSKEIATDGISSRRPSAPKNQQKRSNSFSNKRRTFVKS